MLRREGDGVVFGGDGLFPELSIQGAIIIIVFHKELPAITERLVSESNGHGLLRLPGVAIGIQDGDVEAGQLVLSRGGGSGSVGRRRGPVRTVEGGIDALGGEEVGHHALSLGLGFDRGGLFACVGGTAHGQETGDGHAVAGGEGLLLYGRLLSHGLFDDFLVLGLLGDLFDDFLVLSLLGDLFDDFLVLSLLGDLFDDFFVLSLLGDLFDDFLVLGLLGDLFDDFLVLSLLGDLFDDFFVLSLLSRLLDHGLLDDGLLDHGLLDCERDRIDTNADLLSAVGRDGKVVLYLLIAFSEDDDIVILTGFQTLPVVELLAQGHIVKLGVGIPDEYVDGILRTLGEAIEADDMLYRRGLLGRLLSGFLSLGLLSGFLSLGLLSGFLSLGLLSGLLGLGLLGRLLSLGLLSGFLSLGLLGGFLSLGLLSGLLGGSGLLSRLLGGSGLFGSMLLSSGLFRGRGSHFRCTLLRLGFHQRGGFRRSRFFRAVGRKDGYGAQGQNHQNAEQQRDRSFHFFSSLSTLVDTVVHYKSFIFTAEAVSRVTPPGESPACSTPSADRPPKMWANMLPLLLGGEEEPLFALSPCRHYQQTHFTNTAIEKLVKNTLCFVQCSLLHPISSTYQPSKIWTDKPLLLRHALHRSLLATTH